ncbi:SSU ribosomal protein S19E [Haloarcula quadrata]|uniref:Small ribosomal subunit protein eS19 n=6 Tax=Haloarcula TaxID=2237 RepID=RS19E_HALMA|nr:MULTISPECIES: 30S ribosomal protein S19e [Haloarcula]P19952.3 RecName: Full=Small ribosomal subunit protein eS19; AltName: Full=30S ribosomal protein S19e; AltName: Full=E1.3; AltName: Full=HS12 [Haloarcula marismortui ATCC 43049]AAV47885.1 30S ribosomal protein S19E [Haloarcula marismortui ATCC 43049]EMA12107.1 30S ribosomal protein S19e [Haloarcula sinaiiensis ATCC 33800]EMA17676.1 30S ribosomal protein S19e [Haloarcula californiae ATCC 33799]EMA22416.1 30S ribosomal protein S19e [Haloarc
MATLYDVPPEELIEALTETLADEDDIEAPDWAEFTKTGVDRELPPEQEDFWTRRAASLLRKVAVDGPVGVNALRSEYGTSKQGTTRYRVRPHQKTKGSGNIIRTALQQLEDAGYVETSENDGRRVTGDGRSLLDDTAGDLLTELDRPELERYA